MFPNLLAEMTRQKITQDDIANDIGICHSSINLKLTGKREFTLKEIQLIKEKFFPMFTLDYLFERKEK
jgi:hypothetical protein